MSREGSMAMLGFVFSEDEDVLVLAKELAVAKDMVVRGKAIMGNATVTGDILVAGKLYCRGASTRRYYIPSHHWDLGTVNEWCQVVAPFGGYVIRVSIVLSAATGASGGAMRLACNGIVLSGYDITIPDASSAGAVFTTGDIPNVYGAGSEVAAGNIIYLNVVDACTNNITAGVTFELVRV